MDEHTPHDPRAASKPAMPLRGRFGPSITHSLVASGSGEGCHAAERVKEGEGQHQKKGVQWRRRQTTCNCGQLVMEN